MKLYDTPLAPNPRRVRWVMAEKGIADIQIVTLSLMEGEHRRPEYVAKAGVPRVPALELDDGRVIGESIAICRYLESRWPEPNLFGHDPEETAEIEMWMRRAEMLVASPMMMWVRLTAPPLAVLEPPNPPVADYQRAAAMQGLELLDARLADREWLAAGRLTIADVVAFIGVDFGRLIRFRPPEALTNLGRWAQAMRARPAAKAGAMAQA
jgi:glutathione S-transferase